MAQQKNRGWFRKGNDPRRHQFTREECSAGFWAAIESITERHPDAITSYGAHMATNFLRKRSHMPRVTKRQRKEPQQ